MLGPHLSLPGPENGWQGDHIARLMAAFARVTGRDLVAELGLDTGIDPGALGRSAWEGDFALLSHRGDGQATLNYGNRFALALWEMDWAVFTATPSVATAPPVDVPERGAMMEEVARSGFVGNYTGRRVSATGKLFTIDDGMIWRLLDAKGEAFGVAATFRKITRL